MKIKTARIFMFLAAMLVLKLCFAQTTFTNPTKLDSKHSVQTSQSNHSLSLSITASELEDENEESETENLFYIISFLYNSFSNYYSNHTSYFNQHTSKSLISNNGLYKLNNCFRI